MTTTPLAEATYVLSIVADSGYESTMEGRCDAEQYALAVKALHEPAQARADLEAENAHLKAVLKDVGLFLHHCWCDVQMNEHSFDLLNKQTEAVDAALETKT